MSTDRARNMAKMLAEVRKLDTGGDDPFEIEAEDELPFVQLGHWVALSGVSPAALGLYWMLAMHLNMTRKDRYVWPTTTILAHMLGYSRYDKIKKFIDELVAVGAIVVISVPDGKGPQRRNVYRLRRTPPEGYTGLVSLTSFYALLYEAYDDETAGQPVHPQMGVDVGPQTGAHVGPQTGVVTTRSLNKKNETEDGPLPGHGPAGRRRPSTGSREAEVAGGAAASGKDSSPGDETATNGADAAGGQGKTAATGKGPARLTAEERQARDALLPLLPADFRQALGDVIPKNVAADIVTALAAEKPRERTVQQLVEYRVMPRWNTYWSPKFYAGELTPKLPNGKLKKPFGPLSEMLADTAECKNLSCEDRRDFVIADACRNCEGRKANKRADRAKERQEAAENANTSSPEDPDAPLPAVPAQRHTARFCERCDRRFGPTADPTVSVCVECQEEVAAELFISSPAAPDRWAPADAEAYEEFAAEVDDEPSADELAAAAAEEQLIKEEAELTARLRAQIAAEIGTPEQVEAYVTGAPF